MKGGRTGESCRAVSGASGGDRLREGNGGAKSYLVDGQLKGGVALVAYPAQYKSSGVMTFIINQAGVVYQKDLGEDAANLAKAMTEFNPDSTWKKVTD